MKFSLAAAAFVAIACSQITSACEDRKCGENDSKCIAACVHNINQCLDSCGGGQSCYNQCVSEWTPTITASDGSTVSTSNPLGTATADISGASTLATGTATDVGTASVPTGSINTAVGSSAIPTASDSFASASASLATAFSSATSALSSQFSASLASAASSASAPGASASASTTAKSAASMESTNLAAKVAYTICAMALLAVAL